MRVLLIRPPAYRHATENARSLAPLGLMLLAGSLRRHEVRILDAEMGSHSERYARGFYRVGKSDADIELEIRRFDPDVIGVSGMFANMLPSLFHVARIARHSAPLAKIIAGGYAVSADPEHVRDSCPVDVVVCGEGEHVMEEAMGMGRGIMQRTSVAIDEIPEPDYEAVHIDAYRQCEAPPNGIKADAHVRAMPILTSRGCPVACNFCSVHQVTGGVLRKEDPDRIAARMRRLVGLGVRKFHIVDDNFTLDRKHALQVMERMAPLGVTWNTTQGTNAWEWDEELIDAATSSGMQYLILPVEAGSDRVLREIMHKRPLTVDKIWRTVDLAKSRGLTIQGWCIIGSPGETRADMEATLSLMNDLPLDYRGGAVATPYKGTPLYDECEAKGYIKTPVDYSRLQRNQSIISTPEWSADYVTARLAGWTMKGRIRSGQGIRRSIARCNHSFGPLIAARAICHAIRT